MAQTNDNEINEKIGILLRREIEAKLIIKFKNFLSAIHIEDSSSESPVVIQYLSLKISKNTPWMCLIPSKIWGLNQVLPPSSDLYSGTGSRFTFLEYSPYTISLSRTDTHNGFEPAIGATF